MPSNDAPSFDFYGFLSDNFQTPQGLMAFLTSYGVDVPAFGTIEKWFQRRTVPSTWFAVLVTYLELDKAKPGQLVSYLGGNL